MARACSGLNYFVTSLVLGVLLRLPQLPQLDEAHRCAWRRSSSFPVVLNGLRVYVTILVSHLTEMRFGPGAEHVTFGRVFFVVVMLVMFWIGRRWQDELPMPGPRRHHQSRARQRRRGWHWWPLALAMVLAAAGAAFVQSSIAQPRGRARDGVVAARRCPARRRLAGTGGRGRALAAAVQRRPRRAAGGVPECRTAGSVDVFVAVYGLGRPLGAEMISYNNVVASSENGSLAVDARARFDLPDGGSLERARADAHESEVAAARLALVRRRRAAGGRSVRGQGARGDRIRHAQRGLGAHRDPVDTCGRRRARATAVVRRSAWHCVARGFPVEACGG